MGAALTYARRYALFTLVDIAGEDDLNAPDLVTPQRQNVGPQPPKQLGNAHLNGSHSGPDQPRPTRRDKKHSPNSDKSILGPKDSAELRDRLIGEIGSIASADDAALWAFCNIKGKNGLTTADAQCAEKAFRTALATFVDPMKDLNDRRRRKARSRAGPKSGNGPLWPTKGCWRCLRRAGCVTGTTSDTLPHSLAWSAAHSPVMPTICALLKAVR